MKLTCGQCPNPITPSSKSGLCRPCCCRNLAADPEARAKAVATHRARQSPDFYARCGRAISAVKLRQLKADPDLAARMKEKGLKLAATRLGCTAMSNSQDARRKIAAAVSLRRKRAEAKRMAWCPADRLAEFKRLRRKLNHEDAKAAILYFIERERAKLTPFERQLQAVKNGAWITILPPRRTIESSVSFGVSDIYSCG